MTQEKNFQTPDGNTIKVSAFSQLDQIQFLSSFLIKQTNDDEVNADILFTIDFDDPTEIPEAFKIINQDRAMRVYNHFLKELNDLDIIFQIKPAKTKSLC